MNTRSTSWFVISIIVISIAISVCFLKDEEQLDLGDSSFVQKKEGGHQPRRDDKDHEHSHSLMERLDFDPPSMCTPKPDAIESFTGVVGIVRDNNNEVLSGATVQGVAWFMGRDGTTTNMSHVKSAVTDKDGKFRMPTPQGTFVLRGYYKVDEPHLYGATTAFPIRWGETVEKVVVVGLSYTLSGKIVDENGSAMPGIPVVIVPSMTDSNPVYYRHTNEKGEFSVRGMTGPKSLVSLDVPKGKVASPSGAIMQETTKPFEFVIGKVKQADEPIKLMFNYQGLPLLKPVNMFLYLNDVLLMDQIVVDLQQGDHLLAHLILKDKDGNYSVEFHSPEYGILGAEFERNVSGDLRAEGNGWKAGREVDGFVVGADAPLWVILITEPNAWGRRAHWAEVAKDGSFSFKSVSNRKLWVAVQDRREFLRIKGSRTFPLPPGNKLQITID